MSDSISDDYGYDVGKGSLHKRVQKRSADCDTARRKMAVWVANLRMGASFKQV